MLEEVLHDSQIGFYRDPFGAVACGEKISLRLKVKLTQSPISVKLRLFTQNQGEKLVEMLPVTNDSGELFYQAEIVAPETPAILWYYFMMERDNGLWYYGNNPDNLGGVGAIALTEPPSYQITVHKQNLVTPDWFKDGIMYQIFVDRFYNGQEDGRVLQPRPGCLLHAAWDDKPVYVRDDKTGEILAYDFFGGNLPGILAKLDYLKELGVTVLYLNPVFESPSNHKYDTGNYKKIDQMFGNEADFEELCAKAEKKGIRIILDGVFSHTGSDSLYFNKENNYDSLGAYQSKESPYYKWYRFSQHPQQYESWWGIGNLPNVEETEPSYLDYIIRDDDSVLKKWQRIGAKGWRLDVADELPDMFIKLFYQTMKEADPEAVLIGEVWEDASRKTSYGVLREYLWGEELDSVMNYPFRTALLSFMLGDKSAETLQRELMSLYENYPRQHFYALMNLIGTHDVPRILTLMGEAPSAEGMTVAERRRYQLSPAQLRLGIARVKLLALWQMTFPGVPCVYYGDEAGMTGFSDPFNRGPYPWGHEQPELLAWYKKLGSLRTKHAVLRTGSWLTVYAKDDVYVYLRLIENGRDFFGKACDNNAALVIVNRGQQSQHIVLEVGKWCAETIYDVLEDNTPYVLLGNKLSLELAPLSGKLLFNTPGNIINTEGRSGILLHPTSLPSPYGIGDIGHGAYEFLDFLQAAGQQVWQFLPLNPVGYGYSPYQCLSAFACNHLLISPDLLVDMGLLESRELTAELVKYRFPKDKVAFAGVEELKGTLCVLAFQRFTQQPSSAEFLNFCQQQAYWLEDYALFMALRQHFGGLSWQQWPEDLRSREQSALKRYTVLLQQQVDYQRFLQYVFWAQWEKLKAYAAQKKIQLIGDLPIFVAYDSSDVWAHQQLFSLDAQGRPLTVAGVPPDYFSPTGQLWGNPHYNWDEMKKDDYAWWHKRCKHLLSLVDVIRLDHFRGFEAYWEIPAGAENAVSGKWVKGPGNAFFVSLQKALGGLPFIAEDLGVITDEVEELKEKFALPGMKVLQFTLLSQERRDNLSANYRANSVVYTGTHDNDTTVGWYKELLTREPKAAKVLRDLLGLGDAATPDEICTHLLGLALNSNAQLVVLPLQDVLGLDTKSRMNFPGTVGGSNWLWRYERQILATKLADRFKNMSLTYHRTGKNKGGD